MISKAEILMGRDKEYPLDQEMQDNLQKLLKAVNLFRQHYGKPMYVSSGYRPAAINAKVKGAAKKSNHMVCLAVDFKDTDGSLARFCLSNLHILESCGLYLEDPRWTRTRDENNKIVSGWTHLQIKPTSKRVFIPSNNPPIDPNFWDGKL